MCGAGSRIKMDRNHLWDQGLDQKTRKLPPRLLFYSTQQGSEEWVTSEGGLPQHQYMGMERVTNQMLMGFRERGHNIWAIVHPRNQPSYSFYPPTFPTNNNTAE